MRPHEIAWSSDPRAADYLLSLFPAHLNVGTATAGKADRDDQGRLPVMRRRSTYLNDDRFLHP